jgi:3-oxoacyl-[acyl-carrier protein] reductase
VATVSFFRDLALFGFVMMTLEGKVALVTGASRGIGAGIGRVLARHGAAVAVNYFSSPDLATAVCEEINSQNGRAWPVYSDVTNASDVEAMVAAVQKQLGAIDILVNNAGHNWLKPILDTTIEQWEACLQLNLKSYFLCTKAVLPEMLERGSGRVINISSISGQRGGNSCDVDYSAAKAGILGFTRALAKWAAPKGVLVNAVAPGYVLTDGLLSVAAERIVALRQTIPLGRLGEPEEIGEVVAFLAGPGGNYIVGETISVNGGVHIA